VDTDGGSESGACRPTRCRRGKAAHVSPKWLVQGLDVSRETAPVAETCVGNHRRCLRGAVTRTQRLPARATRGGRRGHRPAVADVSRETDCAEPYSAGGLLLVYSASQRRGRPHGGRVRHGSSFGRRRPLLARPLGCGSTAWRVMNGARSPHGCMYMFQQEDRSPRVVGRGLLSAGSGAPPRRRCPMPGVGPLNEACSPSGSSAP
jgi:hypothetical protein